MLEASIHLLQNTTERSNHYGEEYRVSQAARQLYHRLRQRGWIGQLVAGFTGRRSERHLIALNDFTSGRTNRAQHYAGTQTVRLNEIRGSVGRCHDFDAAFNPLKANTEQRWLRVATARHDGLALPPVQLIQVGDTYFVRDGHHRVSVARALGEDEIEAEVTAWQLA